jgi:hypothetical protein
VQPRRVAQGPMVVTSLKNLTLKSLLVDAGRKVKWVAAISEAIVVKRQQGLPNLCEASPEFRDGLLSQETQDKKKYSPPE